MVKSLFSYLFIHTDTPPSLPYMIRRSRMHNVPVYSDIKHGNQHSTLLRKIEGDIWVSIISENVKTNMTVRYINVKTALYIL